MRASSSPRISFALAASYRLPASRVLLAFALIAILALAGCSRAPAEQRLRETITQMEQAIENGRVNVFLDGVSTEFSGNAGRYDRRELHSMLRAIALRHRDIKVLAGPLDITMHGEDRATVKLHALITGGSGGLLPDSGRRMHIDSGWRQEDGQWRCISATWSE